MGAVAPRYGDLGITVACGDLTGAELKAPMLAASHVLKPSASVCTLFTA